jgi:Zn-dependent metalloprotease
MAHPLLDDLAMRRATSRPPSRPRQPLRRLTCCLLIATLAVPPAATGAARSAPSAEAAISSARSLASSLGLRAGSELVARHHFTNAQGRTVVHADQTFQGRRVWGAQAIIHAEAWGGTSVLPQGLLPDAQPVGQPALTDRRATDIALKSFAAAPGARVKTSSELVVFPGRYMGEVRLKLDPRTGRYGLDRQASALTVAPKDDYVWAYEVRALTRNKVDGLKDMRYVVDARTGAILRSDTGIKPLQSPNPPALKDSDVPVKGTGQSQYSGTVPLDTVRRADGTFALIDRTRASKYNPFLHDWYWDMYGNLIPDEDGKPIANVALQTLTEMHEADPWAPLISDHWFTGNPANEWGDGRQYAKWPYGTEASANGQTAAVDAHFGMAVTWDFYKNVFGRDGIDGIGTAPISEVHALSFMNGLYYDNAYWSDGVFGMFYSDGSHGVNVDPFTGHKLAGDPNGFLSLTSLDIIGHEMTHGVTSHTAGLAYENESGGLNEASSDILGKMVEAYANRLPGTDDRIPLEGADWLVGSKVSPIGAALRSMKHPSMDGLSADSWYAGIRYLDVHYSSGPMNRAFYFLSQGASATVGDEGHSAYLPGGMSGIGNDHAARIWYKTLTEYLTWDADYASARAGAIEAATALYGAGSPDVAAVRNAFAAINVGEAEGQAPRVRIDMPVVHAPGTPLNPWGTGYFARMPIVGMNTTVQLQAQVENSEDQRVVWSNGGRPGDFANPGFRHYGGVATEDGRWTPPTEWGFHAMSVSSKADPLQYAEGVLWVVNGDADGDTEFDAIDLGAVALSWGLDGWVQASHGIVGDGFTDSMDVTAILEALRNAVSFR